MNNMKLVTAFAVFILSFLTGFAVKWWLTFFTDEHFNQQAKVDMHEKFDQSYEWLLSNILKNEGNLESVQE